jgi:hypothetical protein
MTDCHFVLYSGQLSNGKCKGTVTFSLYSDIARCLPLLLDHFSA